MLNQVPHSSPIELLMTLVGVFGLVAREHKDVPQKLCELRNVVGPVCLQVCRSLLKQVLFEVSQLGLLGFKLELSLWQGLLCYSLGLTVGFHLELLVDLIHIGLDVGCVSGKDIQIVD